MEVVTAVREQHDVLELDTDSDGENGKDCKAVSQRMRVKATTCPLSLSRMTVPWRSTRCGHTFDKDNMTLRIYTVAVSGTPPVC